MVDRIKLILKVNNLTASKFADEIGVQRSSISHIVSGRNQPSLDLVQKVLRRFPEIRSEWLLNGNGSMLSNAQPDLFDSLHDTGEEIIESSDLVFNDEISGKEMDEILGETKAEMPEVKENQLIIEEMPEAKPSENSFFAAPIDQDEENEEEINLKASVAKHPKKRIEKIVILYDDRTFKEYFPE
jgi:transcriptional regulator with XRE-family HTH domain